MRRGAAHADRFGRRPPLSRRFGPRVCWGLRRGPARRSGPQAPGAVPLLCGRGHLQGGRTCGRSATLARKGQGWGARRRRKPQGRLLCALAVPALCARFCGARVSARVERVWGSNYRIPSQDSRACLCPLCRSVWPRRPRRAPNPFRARCFQPAAAAGPLRGRKRPRARVSRFPQSAPASFCALHRLHAFGVHACGSRAHGLHVFLGACSAHFESKAGV